MNRRTLLAATALTPFAACSPASTPISTQLTNALTVAQTIDQALVKIINDITNPPISLISPNTQETILADLALASTGISAFLAGTVPPAGASTLEQINEWFTIALNTAAPVLAIALPAATPVVLALEAVDALLPVFEAVIPQPASKVITGRVHSASVAADMTPDKALGVLKTYLGGK